MKTTIKIIFVTLALCGLSCVHAAPLPTPTTNPPVVLTWQATTATTGYQCWSLPGSSYQPASTNWSMLFTAPETGQASYLVTNPPVAQSVVLVMIATNSTATGPPSAPLMLSPTPLPGTPIGFQKQ